MLWVSVMEGYGLHNYRERVLGMELPGRSKRRKPRRIMDVVREDMAQAVGVTGEDAEDMDNLRSIICCDD